MTGALTRRLAARPKPPVTLRRPSDCPYCGKPACPRAADYSGRDCRGAVRLEAAAA